MPTKISIVTGDAPVDIRVRQPGEAPHMRCVVPNDGCDFEITGPATIQIGADFETAVEPVAEPKPEPVEQPVEPVDEANITDKTDADFEAENDANEFVRKPRKR